jgi:hypothetical protein
MQGGMANPWATHFGGGAPGELPITMAQRGQLGGGAPGDLNITMCNQPSQGDARLVALAAKLPNGAPMPATLAATLAAKEPMALEDAKPADAPGALEDAKPAGASGAVVPAVASETPKGKSKLSELAAKILVARGMMQDERAKALWACMYL